MSAQYTFDVTLHLDDESARFLGQVTFEAATYGDDQADRAQYEAESELQRLGRFMNWRGERWRAEYFVKLSVSMVSAIDHSAALSASDAES